MAEGSAKIIVVSLAFAALVGASTAWFMVPRMEPPGGPTVVKAEVGLEAENRKMKEELTTLRRDYSEARLQLAAMRAFPQENPRAQGAPPGAGPPRAPGAAEGLPELSAEDRAKFELYYRAARTREDSDAARALRGMEEAALRASLERASKITPLEADRRDRVVRILVDGADKMRTIHSRAAAAEPSDRSWVADAETLGNETRRRLEEILSPEQLKAVDSILGAGEPAPGEKR